ncbi:LOW QUALITY PROTEIN: E3 ubiquitin-protein ligase Siah2 [Clupea harengus]|uniref:E3 ubiquitin-protein ligase n=1 Tax=Clupea harengus TaxID=7950 RepID=A0A6P8FUG9_CLUHA|nr:LOW QUALITY PROTEIN: E3 ubiquitin-protein ligase Siah2 [Clupea harengus]
MTWGLPQWPCLLSWPQCQGGGAWPRTTSAGATDVTPPVFPDKPPSRNKCIGVGCIQPQHHTELVNTDQKEGSESQPCTCPCGSSCQWQGILGSVVPHLIQAHQPITDREGEEVIFLVSNVNMPDTGDWVMVQSCFGRKFVLVVKKEAVVRGSPTSFFAAVLFVGAREEAEGFVYRLGLRGSRRRLMWEATPRAIQDSVASSAVTDSDCMVFDSAVANLFASSSGTLGIHVGISRSGSSITEPALHAQGPPPHRHSTGRAYPASRTQGSPNPWVT